MSCPPSDLRHRRYRGSIMHLPHDLTGFFRWEESADAGQSNYLKLFPMVVRQRDVIGLRWDFISRQAVTLQLSDTNTLNGHFKDIRLQWSAAFL